MTVPFTICEAVTGRVLRSGFMGTEADAKLQAREGEVCYLGSLGPLQYLRDGEPVDMPARPSALHVWDWTADVWAEDLVVGRAAALDRIEAERIARTSAPIEQGDVLLDADGTAQSNVSAKLQEIAQCRALGLEMPAELLIWRDANNQTHTFDDLDAYAEWLGSLAVAITRRGTQAYAWAWTQKAALSAAADLAAMAAIPSNHTTTTESVE